MVINIVLCLSPFQFVLFCFIICVVNAPVTYYIDANLMENSSVVLKNVIKSLKANGGINKKRHVVPLGLISNTLEHASASVERSVIALPIWISK
jgi:hypothetical protein